MFGGYALQVKHQPYMSMNERDWVVAQAEARALLDNTASVHEADAFVSAKAESKRKKLKLGAHSGADIMSANAKELSSQFIWNYNGVEAVLLGCAVLVNLAGIMFESEYLQRDTYQLESLTYATLTIICASLLYYMLVVWCEVIVAIFPKLDLLPHLSKSEKLDDKRADDDLSKIEDEVNAKARGRESIFVMENNPMRGVIEDEDTEAHVKIENLMKETYDLRQTLDKIIKENRELKRGNHVKSISDAVAFSMGSKRKSKKLFGRQTGSPMVMKGPTLLSLSENQDYQGDGDILVPPPPQIKAQITPSSIPPPILKDQAIKGIKFKVASPLNRTSAAGDDMKITAKTGLVRDSIQNPMRGNPASARQSSKSPVRGGRQTTSKPPPGSPATNSEGLLDFRKRGTKIRNTRTVSREDGL